MCWVPNPTTVCPQRTFPGVFGLCFGVTDRSATIFTTFLSPLDLFRHIGRSRGLNPVPCVDEALELTHECRQCEKVILQRALVRFFRLYVVVPALSGILHEPRVKFNWRCIVSYSEKYANEFVITATCHPDAPSFGFKQLARTVPCHVPRSTSRDYHPSGE